MEERYALGKLALGDKCRPQEFFQGLKEQLITYNENSQNLSIILDNTNTNKSYKTKQENNNNLEEEEISLFNIIPATQNSAGTHTMNGSNSKDQAVETLYLYIIFICLLMSKQ